MRKPLLLVVACLALAGCGGGSNGSSGSDETTTAAAAPAQKTVTISEAEFSLTPNRVSIARPGTVSLRVRNIGQIAHALEIEGNGVEDETDAIQPGGSATLTIKLPKAGSYELYCPIDGHEDKGMKGEVVVGGSTGGMETTGTTTTDHKGGSGY